MIILPTKGKWFNMLLSGEKKEEYRKISPYYTTRFQKVFSMVEDIPVDKSIHTVKFTNGYGYKVPAFIADCYLERRTGKTEWGAEEGVEYYCLVIVKIRWKSMDNKGGYARVYENKYPGLTKSLLVKDESLYQRKKDEYIEQEKLIYDSNVLNIKKPECKGTTIVFWTKRLE